MSLLEVATLLSQTGITENVSDPIIHPIIINPYAKKISKNAPIEQIRIRTLPQYFPNSRRESINTIPTEQVAVPVRTEAPANLTSDAATTQQRLIFSKEENENWGDPIMVKSPNDTRIYFQNINGIKSSKSQYAKWPTIVKTMQDAAIDLVGFAETNVDWSKRSIQKDMTQTLKRYYNHGSISVSRNSMKSDTNYLPGGTLFSSTGHWTSRIIEHLHDPFRLGRWSGQKLRLKKDHVVYIISAYRPVRNSRSLETIGSQTVHTQQHTLLRRLGDPNPNPRQRFIDDLTHLLLKWKEDPKVSIILMLDANETINEEQKGIAQLMKETGLVDIFPRHHGDPCDIATNIKASRTRRIDFMLATENILPYITRCGYLPFYHGFDSDHRGMFLDLHPNWIDGKIQLGVQITRSISTSTKKSELLSYKQYIVKEFINNNIFDKAEVLYNTASADKHNDPAFLADINALDAQVVSIGLKAEQLYCTKRPSTDWSPPIHQASLRIRYWVVAVRGMKNKINVTRQLDFIMKDLNESSKQNILNNKLSFLSALRKSKEDKVELMKRHKELRAAYLSDRIRADSEYEHISISQATKRIANKEQCSRIFAELREIFHQGQRSGISHIMVPDKDKDGNRTDNPLEAVTWSHITIPNEIETTLLNYSIGHFGQAQGTEFTIPPLIDNLGYHGTNDTSNSVTDGDIPFSITKLSPGAIAILKRIANKQHLPPIDDEITFDEFWQGIKRWNEKTSTSPSTRHLGHYKALQCSDGSDQEYSDSNPNPSIMIMKVYYFIALAAMKSGNTLDRWCHATTAIIEKIPGTPKLNKLRVIHLYEADYNMMLKLLWARKLVWHSHINNKLNDGQAGSRPGRRALDIIIKKEMKYLYSRITRTSLASMDNDAKSCYDRIICSLAMMVSRYYGMTNRACYMQSSTLQKMQFRLRTALGESVRDYKDTASTPIHGSGQGSCASPCLWLLISSLLIDCLEEMGGGMSMCDINNMSIIKQWLDGYVDDTTLFANLSTNEEDNIQDLTSSLQHDMRSWASLLEASGGQLELSKCFYSILAWKFTPEGDADPLSLQDIKDITNPITIYNKSTKQSETITIKCVSEAHRTLGAWKSMTGCEKVQTTILQDKSNAYAAIVRSTNLSRRQARVAYSSLYIPAMSYCLAAVNLSEVALNTIQRKAVDAFLPAMGYDHSFPRAIVYGPRNFGGLNVGNLYTEQCTAKITTMMLHIRANTTLGRIMRCNLDWTQLYSGLDIPILESTDPLTYITDNWFLQLRNFLITINGTISIKNVWRPQLERNGDCILMKIFQKSGLPPASLRLVNNWRLYFQVSTLSDICNATGTTILLNYRKRPQGIKRAYIRTSKLRWPRQAEPGPYGFRYWMYCLKHCCGMDTMGNIPRRLGNWIVSPTSSNSIWTSYMSTQTKLLYLKCVDGYQVFIPTYSRTQSCRYSLQHSSLSTDVPADAIPVGVLIKETSQEIDHRSIQILSAQPAIQPATFDQFVNKAPGWSADLLQNWSSVEINTIQQAMNLIDNPLLMVSDGGLRFDQGTYGVVIADLNTILIQNQGIAHGSRTLHSSFRAESYGMISGCHTLYSILQFHKITVPANKQLQIFSDNLGLITRINKHLYESMSLRDHGAPDIDIELQILSELRALRLLGFRISVSHVKGHQDRTTLFQNLPREAQLNVEADTLATESFDSTDKSVYQPFPANNTALKIGDTFITSKQRETLHSSHLSQALRAHMVHQFDWSEGLPSQIWWSIHGKAIQLLSHNDRMRIQKFIFNRWATNSRQAKYFSHILPVCSTCSHSTENEDHILRCLSPSRAQLRVLWLNDLDRFLSAPHTHDAVRQAILLGINAWLKNTKPPTLQLSIPDASTQLLQAYEDQAIIGWDHFLRGRLSLVWAHLAQFHLETQGISNICMSAERWGRRIISINWIGVLSLWECRNSEEHGDTQEEQTIKSKAKLISEAIAIQATKFPISYVDREYLFRSIEDLEKYSLGGLTNWIRNARHLINTYKLDSPDFRKRTRYKPNEEEETT